MRFFKEVDVAPLCYLFEAVEWIVRGTVPVFEPDEDGSDVRGSLSAYLQEYGIGREPLTPSELAYFGANVPYKDYLDAWVEGEYERGFWHRDHLPPSVSSANLDFQNWEKTRVKLKADARQLLNTELAEFFDQIEQAKTELLAALIKGNLAVTGYWAENEDDFLTKAEVGEVSREVIAPNEISPSRIDWDADKMVTRERRSDGRSAGVYFLVALNTDEVVKAFPHRYEQLENFKVMNGNAVMDSEVEASAFSLMARRGRPPRTPWLKPAMQSWYQSEAGRIGNFKAEAQVAEAIAWAESLGEIVSRSTVQNYLKDLIPTK